MGLGEGPQESHATEKLFSWLGHGHLSDGHEAQKGFEAGFIPSETSLIPSSQAWQGKDNTVVS